MPKLTRDRLRTIIREEKQRLREKEERKSKEEVLREKIRDLIRGALRESAEDAAEDADSYMDDGMPKDVAARAAADKHDESMSDVKDKMSEVRKVVRSEIRSVLQEVRPKDFRSSRRKLSRYLESHAVTDTQMDDLVHLVSRQGLPGGLDEWMDMHAEPFMNLDRDRLEELLVSSGVAQP